MSEVVNAQVAPLESEAPGPATDQASCRFSVIVANRPGVLSRIALVFSRRGFNIEGLDVYYTQDRRFAHLTISSQGRASQLGDIAKQTVNLVDILDFHIVPDQAPKAHEQGTQRLTLALEAKTKPVVLGLIEQFHYRIVDFADNTLVVEASSASIHHGFCQLARQYCLDVRIHC